MWMDKILQIAESQYWDKKRDNLTRDFDRSRLQCKHCKSKHVHSTCWKRRHLITGVNKDVRKDVRNRLLWTIGAEIKKSFGNVAKKQGVTEWRMALSDIADHIEKFQ